MTVDYSIYLVPLSKVCISSIPAKPDQYFAHLMHLYCNSDQRFGPITSIITSEAPVGPTYYNSQKRGDVTEIFFLSKSEVKKLTR